MGFFQDLLGEATNGVKAAFGSDYLRDYTHASKTFRTNSYQNAPKFKFLFHVYFDINQDAFTSTSSAVNNFGILVKTVKLPTYGFQTHEMNQYNRKRLVQKKIEYQPVQFTFHDDGGDQVRNLWYNYFAYYYKDPSQKYGNLTNTNGSMGALIATPAGFDYNARDTYSQSRPVNDWGYIGESYSSGQGKLPFFQDIRVYGLDQHNFVEYVLVNPMITEWQHDTYDYSQGNGVMQHTMTVRYETVKYLSGALGQAGADSKVNWPDTAHYDTLRSPIARAGSTASVFGQGGLLSTGQGILQDLQSGSVAGLIGAAQKAGAAYNTFKGKDIKAIALEEAKQAAVTVARQSLPGAARAVIGTSGTSVPGAGAPVAQRGALDGLFFPTPPRGNANNTGVASPVGSYNPGFAPTGPGRVEI